MKPHPAVILGLAACSLLSCAAPTAAGGFDEAHRFIFHAVLEGCFEDGLANEDVAQILLRRPGESYFHFIYGCPLCMPAIHALEVYRSRPAEFFGAKPGPHGVVGTFGPGLKPVLQERLHSADPKERLRAINTLMQGWFARRLSSLALSPGERTQLQKAIAQKREEGMNHLKGFKHAKFERGEHAGRREVLFYAPGYADVEECAVCNAACGRKAKIP